MAGRVNVTTVRKRGEDKEDEDEGRRRRKQRRTSRHLEQRSGQPAIGEPLHASGDLRNWQCIHRELSPRSVIDHVNLKARPIPK